VKSALAIKHMYPVVQAYKLPRLLQAGQIHHDLDNRATAWTARRQRLLQYRPAYGANELTHRPAIDVEKATQRTRRLHRAQRWQGPTGGLQE
jgi:hypothetical protein